MAMHLGPLLLPQAHALHLCIDIALPCLGWRKSSCEEMLVGDWQRQLEAGRVHKFEMGALNLNPW